MPVDDVLLCGEGPSDIGSGQDPARIDSIPEFTPGPMAWFVIRMIERTNASTDILGRCRFVPRSLVQTRAKKMRPAAKKKMKFPGDKSPKETRFFFYEAQALGMMARELPGNAIAVLFHDCDSTVSAGRGNWRDKAQSVLDGFEEAGFSRGVPMIPNPKSEAWLLCALKKSPYQSCANLESRSGNDNSPKSLKKELQGRLDKTHSGKSLSDLVQDGQIDVMQIDMPSMKAFRDRLQEVVKELSTSPP